MSSHSTLIATIAALILTSLGCGPSDQTNPTCSPSANAHTESCWVFDQQSVTIRNAGELEKICKSSCSKIADLKVIGANKVEDLMFLEGIDRIDQIYLGNNKSLAELDGLSGVESIGYIKSRNNPRLTDVSALGSVGEITATLAFVENKALEDVEGLEDIETIGAENDSNSAVLRFEANDSLRNLDGLSGLKTIANGETYIIRNPKLRRIGGLQDITEFPDGLNVSDNAKLEDITSLYGTDTIGKSLSIIGNPKLPSCQAQRIANNAMVENGVSIGDNGSGDCMEQ